jgi:DNA repair exonuclease SbcCD ATPase subunit
VITYVNLENWKSYRTFELKLQRGTTFLVAANGVGKTSFIDAVQWALDRGAAPSRAVMRRRTRTTSVIVEIIAGDSTIRVKRTLTLGRAKAPADKVEAWIDDKVAGSDEAFKRLADTWKVDNRFLSRAAFLTDRFLDKDAEPDLRSHLTRLHALDRVQDVIGALGPAIKTATDLADNARKETKASEGELQQAITDELAAAAALTAARAQAESLRGEVTTATNELNAAQRAKQARADHAAWLARRAEVIADAEAIIGPIPEGTPLGASLRSAEAGASQQLTQLTERRARLDERVAALEGSLERLRTSEGECPVCRRPLDAQSRTHAEEAHQHDHEVATAELEALDVDPFVSVASTLRRLVERSEALGDAPAVPEGEVADPDALSTRLDEAKEAFETALGDARQAELDAANSTAKRQALEAQRDATSPVALYTRVAALETARSALEGTVTKVLEAQLGPVSDEVNRRWEAVFPDRPGLRLDSTGQMARTFDDDDEEIDFAAFSSGEKVVAKLLLRLATLTSATEVPFCWIDEPLEHLDPDARSYVAQTLAYLSSYDALTQIVVTTYEQDLALQLADGASEQVRLEFLKTAPVAAQ